MRDRDESLFRVLDKKPPAGAGGAVLVSDKGLSHGYALTCWHNIDGSYAQASQWLASPPGTPGTPVTLVPLDDVEVFARWGDLLGSPGEAVSLAWEWSNPRQDVAVLAVPRRVIDAFKLRPARIGFDLRKGDHLLVLGYERPHVAASLVEYEGTIPTGHSVDSTQQIEELSDPGAPCHQDLFKVLLEVPWQRGMCGGGVFHRASGALVGIPALVIDPPGQPGEKPTGHQERAGLAIPLDVVQRSWTTIADWCPPAAPRSASRLPLPVALLVRQARDRDRTSRDRHLAACWAWEVSLRLAVAARLAADPVPLASAPLGTWAAHARPEVAPLGSPAVRDVYAHFTALGPAGRQAPGRVPAGDLLRSFAVYRERVATGGLATKAACEEAVPLLVQGLDEAWSEGVFLPGGESLVHVDAVDPDAGHGRRGLVRSLSGHASEQADLPSPVPREVEPGQVHLRRDGSWPSLHPWVLFRPGDPPEQLLVLEMVQPEGATYREWPCGRALAGKDLEEAFPGAGARALKHFQVQPALPGPRVPDVKLVRVLHQGRTGTIRLGCQRSLGRDVAVKVLAPGRAGDSKAAGRLRREARALARVHHPNVVKLLWAETDAGTREPWLVMEHVDGVNLELVLRHHFSGDADLDMAITAACAEARGGERDRHAATVALRGGDRWAGLAELFRDAALGLHHLHRHGIVHRDLSARSLMLKAADHQVVVVGLGRAALDEDAVATSLSEADLLDTLRRQAPEARRRAPLDGRVDVYGLGATLYEALARRPPHEGATEGELRAGTARVLALREASPDVPAELARIVERALAPDPEERWASAADLAEALDGFARGRRQVGEADTQVRYLGGETVFAEAGAGLPDGAPEAGGGGAAVKPGPRYERRGKLGEGGMGVVHAVWDEDLERRVALKVSKLASPEARRRFLGEARAMAGLEHPSILPLYDRGLDEQGQPYYTMREQRGESLEKLLDRLRSGEAEATRTCSHARLVQILIQVCGAVGYAHAHARKVVHRDLKPANVLVGEHGEVQVIDWGLAVATGEGAAAGPVHHKEGSPPYMSPEQTRGEAAGACSDLWSLGVMLYEMLCLERPFQGGTLGALFKAIQDDDPVPPRDRAPARQVPLLLEAICLRALRKRPEDRYRSAEEMVAALRDWLEAEADQARRHEQAEAKAGEGEARLEGYRRLKEVVARLDEEAKAQEGRFKGYQPLGEKEPLFEARARAREARRQVTGAASAVLGTLTEALGFEAENPRARGLLADYYLDRFREAERKGEADDVEFFKKLVAEYDGGRYRREREGTGSLALTSEPEGAEVWIRDLDQEQRGPRLVERNDRPLGTTPLEPLPLEMGSYLVVLKKRGYRDVRYPVHITRNRDWTGSVNLYTEEEIGRGMIYVPAGPFVLGGDPEAYQALPREERVLDDFFIAEHPVTFGEYLEFLNALAASRGVEEAAKRGPRGSPEAGHYLRAAVSSPSFFELPEFLDRRFPVFGVSWDDARAYCEWRSGKEGRRCDLPDEAQWEKAARGVDGRWFPWGFEFDPSLCCMVESKPKVELPARVDEFPADVSVYGVRGMAGNMSDWTASESVITGARDVRGGAWGYTRLDARCASRTAYAPACVFALLGFRVVLEARRTR